MPLHDWTRVSAGIYHDFHQDWTIEIRRTLNGGILPPGYYAMADQRVSGPEPDIIALRFAGPNLRVGSSLRKRLPASKRLAALKPMRRCTREKPTASRFATSLAGSWR